VGGFITTYTPLGFAGLGIAFAFLFSALYRLWRSPAEGARVVFPAVAVLMVGGVAVALRPLSTVVPETFAPLFTFPYNATMMGVAVLILGRAVLQKQLFDPLRRLNRQLIETNQRLAHAQRHKTLFLTNMSHELRTPLSAIIGYNDLLLNGIYGELSPKQIDRLERVKANAQHLLALINDVLDLSKIEAGSLKLYPQTLDASELLDALCERYAKSAREKNLAFSLQTEGDLKLEADKARLEQILNNLLSNALKFTPQGEVTLYAVGENRQVRFEVQDTGIGIPPQALPFIFDVFRQVDDATTRQHEGTGAGSVSYTHLTLPTKA
jgi:signal transduction histidine kinase